MRNSGELDRYSSRFGHFNLSPDESFGSGFEGEVCEETVDDEPVQTPDLLAVLERVNAFYLNKTRNEPLSLYPQEIADIFSREEEIRANLVQHGLEDQGLADFLEIYLNTRRPIGKMDQQIINGISIFSPEIQALLEEHLDIIEIIDIIGLHLEHPSLAETYQRSGPWHRIRPFSIVSFIATVHEFLGPVFETNPEEQIIRSLSFPNLHIQNIFRLGADLPDIPVYIINNGDPLALSYAMDIIGPDVSFMVYERTGHGFLIALVPNQEFAQQILKIGLLRNEQVPFATHFIRSSGSFVREADNRVDLSFFNLYPSQRIQAVLRNPIDVDSDYLNPFVLYPEYDDSLDPLRTVSELERLNTLNMMDLSASASACIDTRSIPLHMHVLGYSVDPVASHESQNFLIHLLRAAHASSNADNFQLEVSYPEQQSEISAIDSIDRDSYRITPEIIENLFHAEQELRNDLMLIVYDLGNSLYSDYFRIDYRDLMRYSVIEDSEQADIIRRHLVIIETLEFLIRRVDYRPNSDEALAQYRAVMGTGLAQVRLNQFLQVARDVLIPDLTDRHSFDARINVEPVQNNLGVGEYVRVRGEFNNVYFVRASDQVGLDSALDEAGNSIYFEIGEVENERIIALVADSSESVVSNNDLIREAVSILRLGEDVSYASFGSGLLTTNSNNDLEIELNGGEQRYVRNIFLRTGRRTIFQLPRPEGLHVYTDSYQTTYLVQGENRQDALEYAIRHLGYDIRFEVYDIGLGEFLIGVSSRQEGAHDLIRGAVNSYWPDMFFPTYLSARGEILLAQDGILEVHFSEPFFQTEEQRALQIESLQSAQGFLLELLGQEEPSAQVYRADDLQEGVFRVFNHEGEIPSNVLDVNNNVGQRVTTVNLENSEDIGISYTKVRVTMTVGDCDIYFINSGNRDSFNRVLELVNNNNFGFAIYEHNGEEFIGIVSTERLRDADLTHEAISRGLSIWINYQNINEDNSNLRRSSFIEESVGFARMRERDLLEIEFSRLPHEDRDSRIVMNVADDFFQRLDFAVEQRVTAQGYDPFQTQIKRQGTENNLEALIMQYFRDHLVEIIIERISSIVGEHRNPLTNRSRYSSELSALERQGLELINNHRLEQIPILLDQMIEDEITRGRSAFTRRMSRNERGDLIREIREERAREEFYRNITRHVR